MDDIAKIVEDRINKWIKDVPGILKSKLRDDIKSSYDGIDIHPSTPTVDPIDESKIISPANIVWEEMDDGFKVSEKNNLNLRSAKIHEVYGLKPFLIAKRKFLNGFKKYLKDGLK